MRCSFSRAEPFGSTEVDCIYASSCRPTLYLRKFWRQVSPQGPIYHTFRDPIVMRYSAKLYLVLPPNNETRVFEVNGYRTLVSTQRVLELTLLHTATKRAAKKAASERAIACNIEEKARQSMAAMDRIGTENEPLFKSRPLPKREERFNQAGDLSHQEDATAMLAQNPVTALNLAVCDMDWGP